MLPEDHAYWTFFLSKREKRGTVVDGIDNYENDDDDDDNFDDEDGEDIEPNPALIDEEQSLCVLI